MRRPAKASPAGSSPTIGRATLSLACFCLLAFAAIAGSAGTAVAAAAEGCPNASIRAQQGSESLPDCRAWEKVSPADKNNSDILTQGGYTAASVNGDGVAYSSKGAFAGAVGTSTTTGYVARREGGSWTTTSTTPPVNADAFGLYRMRLIGPFSSDLSQALIRNQNSPALTENAQDGVNTLYLRNNLTGSYLNLTPTPEPWTPGLLANVAVFSGASDDLSHVLVQSYEMGQPLVAGGPTWGNYAYEVNDGTVHLASIVNGEPVEAFAGVRNDYSDLFNSANPIPGTRSVSRDGRVMAFVTMTGQIYVRVDGRETIHVSASQRTDCAEQSPCSGTPEPDPEGPTPATFLTMSGDGSAVLFKSMERLTNDANLRGFSEERSSLYLYDLRTGKLLDLTANSPTKPGVRAFYAISEDGHTVYFAAQNDLTGDPSSGSTNLYVWRDGHLRLVAAGIVDEGEGAVDPYHVRTAMTTPDGSGLVFTTMEPLKGESFTPENPQSQCVGYGGNCREVYVYDARSEALHCISCGWRGKPSGDARLSGPPILGVHELTEMTNRPISADGSRVFFSSPDALVPGDVNGAYDVYEWERPGTNECRETSAAFQAQAGGCLYLISSGEVSADSYFLEADPEGNNVFFASGSRLVAVDRDSNVDLYDARVGGGIAAQQVSPESRGCAGDECQGSPGIAPAPPSIGAASFHGPANRRIKRKAHRAKRKARHAKHTGHAAEVHGPRKRGSK